MTKKLQTSANPKMETPDPEAQAAAEHRRNMETIPSYAIVHTMLTALEQIRAKDPDKVHRQEIDKIFSIIEKNPAFPIQNAQAYNQLTSNARILGAVANLSRVVQEIERENELARLKSTVSTLQSRAEAKTNPEPDTPTND